ncbi:TIGR03086 family metal-binding protein [Streptomyces sp. NBC_01387]|uniref:TIGR03086 family metal-binding protein n=1 Tax=unclassified Streptomyces TaxID=2593676 RepID=UPI0020247C44|nr:MULTISPECIES: TIGR03086 family metal-binding protein [unclassified Streptomyces]MCX4554091.1 TIGR03086 family metal-binding protein [Streptomyces sp. NBC_01500]WSC19002.1 TIGR03086 family metal-binding protein [Streptomyces sp. NBC_01766]
MSSRRRASLRRVNTYDLGPAARSVADLLDAIDDTQLSGPTPCPDYSVGELLAHVVGLTAAFRAAAEKDFGPATDTAPGTTKPVLEADWRTVLPRQLDEVAAAWRTPESREGQTRAGAVDLPAEVAGQVALNELVVHGWDLARATGQPYAVDDASLQVSYGLLKMMNQGGQTDIFGPAVAVPEGAPFIDRVIGSSGRSPEWRP